MSYQQITDDAGQPAVLGSFQRAFSASGRSYISPIGSRQAFLGLRGHGEFAADNRASGWNTRLTFSISEAVPASTVTPTKHLERKQSAAPA